ncbi:MAG TPA: hypothetical protein VK469_23975 [Candidatus Kapabacteria bacterium]|nr:hypothetical protein [Candidatus Kapabacteria bacterium]
MIFKKTLILLMALLIMLFSLLNAVPSSQEIEDENDMEQLIDKADYCFGVLEDYPLALKYLNRAEELALVPDVKAGVLIKTAYVYFLMGKNTGVYSDYIKKALTLDGALELDRLLYRERFIKIFTMIKNKPQATSREIETRLLQEGEKKNSGWNRFFVMINAGYMFSIDSDYKKIYGSGTIFPRVKVGFKIVKNFYMWGGYGAVKGKGIVPGIGTDAQSAQKFLTLGFKYTRDFTGNFGYKLEASTAKISYSEKALGTEAKGTASGFDLEAGLVYNLGKRLFSEFYTGYLYASKFLLNRKVSFGGFSAGLGFGMKF